MKAPWTKEICDALNRFQSLNFIHPFTCGNDSRHKVLVAHEDGWRCPDCDYRQNWASPSMLSFPPIYTSNPQFTKCNPALRDKTIKIDTTDELT